MVVAVMVNDKLTTAQSCDRTTRGSHAPGTGGNACSIDATQGSAGRSARVTRPVRGAGRRAGASCGSEAKCELVNNVPTLTLDAKFIGFSSTKAVTGKVTVGSDVKFDAAVPVTWNANGSRTMERGPTRRRPPPARCTRSSRVEVDERADSEVTPLRVPPPTPPRPRRPHDSGTDADRRAVLPETVASGSRLRGPSGCVKQP